MVAATNKARPFRVEKPEPPSRRAVGRALFTTCGFALHVVGTDGHRGDRAGGPPAARRSGGRRPAPHIGAGGGAVDP